MSEGVEARLGSTTDAPRLTVLVPCWNAASTIEVALASILVERDVSLECIVIDDGSTDGTSDLVAALVERDSRVVLLRLPTNGGVSNARNEGLRIARGEWICFHDADDRFMPGGLAALMRPARLPDVLAVIGQRVWTDGERTWLSPLYDIPDIREPGRKSIATHPGLLYYVTATGKVYHRSILDGLWFEGRVLGDQSWTIRALLRAGSSIEVIGDTVFEYSRPHPAATVETITSRTRASAAGAAEMATVARTVFVEVSREANLRIDDASTRDDVLRAYLERLIVSDLGGLVRKAIERRDPDTGRFFDAMTTFLAVVPPSILAQSDHLVTSVLWPPVRYWRTLPPSARGPYRRMLRQALRADPWGARVLPPRIARRAATRSAAFAVRLWERSR